MSHVDLDVLVVGAGPTGLTLAAALRRYDVRCRIIDRAPRPTAHTNALVMQPRSLELFSSLGLAEALCATGRPMPAVDFYLDGERFARAQFDKLDSPFPALQSISQAQTERVLNEHVARVGAPVERGVELTALCDEGKMVRATLRDMSGNERQVHARWVVGCDGAHSTVRALAGLEFAGASYARVFLQGDVRIASERLEKGAAAIVFARHHPGVALVFPLADGGRARVIVPGPSGEPHEGDLPLASLQAAVDRVVPGMMTLSDPAWLVRFHLHARGVRRMQADRIFVAGDAAHIHSPAGAQGMNTGIQDAFNLAWKLALVARGVARPSLLTSYQDERHPVARRVIRLTDLAFRFGLGENRLLRAIRSTLAPRIMPREELQRVAIRAISELDIQYREGELIADDGTVGRGPNAGQRAPDARLIEAATGASLQLMADVFGPAHVLLAFDGEKVGHDVRDVAKGYEHVVRVLPIARANTLAPTWLDPDDQARRKYGVGDEGALFLVRPDGYLAFVGTRADALRGLLETTFFPSYPASDAVRPGRSGVTTAGVR